MKRKIIALFILIPLLLTACAAGNPDGTGSTPPSFTGNSGSTASTPPVSGGETSEPPTDPKPVDISAVIDSISKISDWRNQVLSSEYTKPEDVNILKFFMYGFDDESREPTQEEQAVIEELKSKPYYQENYDLIRLPVEKMDAVLLDCFGLTLAETNGIGLEDLVYSQETDCYYYCTLGSDHTHTPNLRTETLDDGTTALYYDDDESKAGEYQVIIDANGKVRSHIFIKPEDTHPTDWIAMEQLLGDYQSWYNRALTCAYDSPEKLSIKELFYSGFGERTPTEEEWAALKDKPGFDENYDFMRLPVDEMDPILTEYFGIALDDIEPEGFEGLTYLESTNCFYFMASDFNGVDVAVTNMVTAADGTVQVHYIGALADEYIVTMKPNGDGYLILSNLPA